MSDSLLGLLSTVTICRTFRYPFQQDTQDVHIYDYTEDHFHGVVWRWNYPLFGNIPQDIWCYCPFHDLQLVYRYESNNTLLYCEDCKRDLCSMQGDKDDVIAQISRQIDKKIRTNEWRLVLQKDNA